MCMSSPKAGPCRATATRRNFLTKAGKYSPHNDSAMQQYAHLSAETVCVSDLSTLA